MQKTGESMFDKLKSILTKVDAEYADLRYETKKETKIVFNGKELNEVGSNTTDGYVLRVLHHGGYASLSFTDIDRHEDAIRIVVQNAHLMSKAAQEPVVFKKTRVIRDSYAPVLQEDPRDVTIEEKLQLTRKYNDIIMRTDKIATTNISYGELIRDKHFLSTDGTEIREELLTTRISGLITSRDGKLIQNVRVAAGGSNGFANLRNREADFEKRAGIAVDLLSAQPIDGGCHNVIVNQSLGGVFTHEAFGHFSEADIIENNRSMREKMRIGAKLGNDIVSITDDPGITDQLGHYSYDDEGVKAQRTRLLEHGVLVGHLHSRRTAASFEEPLNGHCVAEDYRYAPIIRMGTIFMEPGENSFEELLSMLGDGYYLLDAKGGQTSGENFTFGAQYGFIVRNGKIGGMVRDINISGNLYSTLSNISAIGNDLKYSQVGGCGKGQKNIRSCYGTPHLLVKNLIIGGR
jgi:TldD protein